MAFGIPAIAVGLASGLLSQLSTRNVNSSPPQPPANQHHHVLSQLGLSSDQQKQINQLVQNAQSNGTSSNFLLSQISNVLSNSQQTKLATLLSTGTYTAGGAASTGNQPYLLNTSA